MTFREAVKYLVDSAEWQYNERTAEAVYAKQLEAVNVIMLATGINDEDWVTEYDYLGTETEEELLAEFRLDCEPLPTFADAVKYLQVYWKCHTEQPTDEYGKRKLDLMELTVSAEAKVPQTWVQATGFEGTETPEQVNEQWQLDEIRWAEETFQDELYEQTIERY